MRSLFLAMVWILCPAFSQGQSGDYEIAEVNPAANTFTGIFNGQPRTLRVRPSVVVTINGLKATFAELEPGMKAKVDAAEPGVATKVAATGIRTRPPAPATQSTAMGASQSARQFNAMIPAASANGFPIGDVRKGTKISIQYKSGKWKSWGTIPTENPDGEKAEGGDLCRVVVSLPGKDGKGGSVLALVPPNTRKRPFVFDALSDYPGIVLRINDKDNSFPGNPGTVEYSVKILPPGR